MLFKILQSRQVLVELFACSCVVSELEIGDFFQVALCDETHWRAVLDTIRLSASAQKIAGLRALEIVLGVVKE